jgi:hypothetical protein
LVGYPPAAGSAYPPQGNIEISVPEIFQISKLYIYFIGPPTSLFDAVAGYEKTTYGHGGC